MRAPLFLLALALAACQDDDPCAGSGLPDSATGLELTDDHAGWGRDQCFQCHHIVSVHRSSCIDGVDAPTLWQLGADPEDTTTCAACHGDNGVQP